MNISDAAGEVLTRASMLVEERSGKSVCIEDILYGLLSLAVEKDSVEEAYRSEARRLAVTLLNEFKDLPAAMEKISSISRSAPETFTPSDAVLGRAVEMSNDGEVTAQILCEAMLEIRSPVLDSLCDGGDSMNTVNETNTNLIFGHFASSLKLSGTDSELFHIGDKDNLTNPEASLGGIDMGSMTKAENEDEDSSSVDDAVMREPLKIVSQENGGKSPDQERKEKERLEKEKREKAERERIERERREREERLRRERELREREEREKQAKKEKRTKIRKNLLKFFLALIIPPIIFTLLDQFTTVFNGETGSALLLVLICGFGWLFLVFRRLHKFVWMKNVHFGFFLDILEDVCFVALLGGAVSTACYGDNYPVWLKISMFIACLGFMTFGYITMDDFPEDEDYSVLVLMGNKIRAGTVSRLMLRNALWLLMLPMFIYFPLWILNRTLPLWMERTLLIAAFFPVWYFFFTLYDCLTERADLPVMEGKAKKRLLRFFECSHILMALPEFVAYLHLLFDWRLKIWVMVLMGLSVLGALVGSVVACKEEGGNLLL